MATDHEVEGSNPFRRANQFEDIMYSPNDKITITFDDLISYTFNFEGYSDHAYDWAQYFFDEKKQNMELDSAFPHRSIAHEDGQHVYFHLQYPDGEDKEHKNYPSCPIK